MDRQRNGRNEKQLSTKHTHKIKDRGSRISPNTVGERRFSGRVSSSCSTSGTRRMPDPIFSMIHICTNFILSNLSDIFTVQVPEYFPGFRADHCHPFSWRDELFD